MKVGFLRRTFPIALLVLFVLLQTRLWTGDGSLLEVSRLTNEVSSQKFTMDALGTRNQMLEAEVQDLKQRVEALEERARNDLGMIKHGETFYQYLR
jgi:cell division protein FtsB